MITINTLISGQNTNDTRFPNILETQTDGLYIKTFGTRDELGINISASDTTLDALKPLMANGLATLFFGVSGMFSNYKENKGIGVSLAWGLDGMYYALYYAKPTLTGISALDAKRFDQYHSVAAQETAEGEVLFISSTRGVNEIIDTICFNRDMRISKPPPERKISEEEIYTDSTCLLFCVWLNSSKSHSDFQTEWDIVANSQFIITED